MTDLIVKFEYSIRKGIDKDADICRGKEKSPSLIAQIIAHLPQDEFGRVHPVFCWGSETLILDSEVTPDSTQLTLSKSFSLSLRGAEQAHRWLDRRREETVENLRAIREEFYRLEEVANFDEFIEEKI